MGEKGGWKLDLRLEKYLWLVIKKRLICRDFHFYN